MNSKTVKELVVEAIAGTQREERDEQKATYIICELSYRKDGVRMSRTGEVFPRGYEVHVDVRERGYGKVFMSEQFILGDCISLRERIEPANAFSAKRFTALQTDPKVLEVVARLKAQALEQWHEKQAKKEEQEIHYAHSGKPYIESGL